MSYKPITYTIKQEELTKNKIINRIFIIEKEDRSVIVGKVKNKDGKGIVDCAVILQEIDKNTDESIDIKIIFTNSEGEFGFSIYLKENKYYKVIAYTPNNLI